jgi:hypothetical protein
MHKKVIGVFDKEENRPRVEIGRAREEIGRGRKDN